MRIRAAQRQAFQPRMPNVSNSITDNHRKVIHSITRLQNLQFQTVKPLLRPGSPKTEPLSVSLKGLKDQSPDPKQLVISIFQFPGCVKKKFCRKSMKLRSEQAVLPDVF